jgi:hypothetical protein
LLSLCIPQISPSESTSDITRNFPIKLQFQYVFVKAARDAGFSIYSKKYGSIHEKKVNLLQCLEIYKKCPFWQKETINECSHPEVRIKWHFTKGFLAATFVWWIEPKK